ncbi:hypothetical protein PSECIP111951_00995 [Pseudoalteromonas holothuriae]|uniref:Amine oxidase domain-containing protein n=1 Tax=Pseudoalteromonas holothuriae TaxID=2963714 RepID=A0ABN8UI72_9GAMM|nr:FAD-dependent oxidoreductase [Pseudoalteromonas sp. CIP111951]CAH9054256.1 hypothetical protein PSECIP111951_00995 [Pseudoalteromonas sp. CIP111951]
MTRCIVIGGGITGLFSAILASKYFDNVTLIENAPKCGGLLQSWQDESGNFFDLGTHILSETSNQQINDILFKGIYENPQDWHQFEVMKVSSSFNSARYDTGQFVPLHYLDEGDYEKALLQLLNAKGLPIEQADNLEQFAIENYGLIVTDKIFRPIMLKLQNAELKDLHPSVHYIFGLSRFIPGSVELARELKKSPCYDAKLAFATYYDGVSDVPKYYPKRGGVELWIDYLVEQATELGVEIQTSQCVTNVAFSDSKITDVILGNGEQLSCDHIIWTIPPVFALKLLDWPLANIPVRFCPTSLHHFVLDKPFIDKNFYSNVYDINSIPFRVTFYPNITNDNVVGPYNCTVEVLGEFDLTEQALNDQIILELKSLGYIEQGASVVSVSSTKLAMGFPQFSNAFVNERIRQIDALEAGVKNMTLLGKASKKEFFIYSVLQEAYEQLTYKFDDSLTSS